MIRDIADDRDVRGGPSQITGCERVRCHQRHEPGDPVGAPARQNITGFQVGDGNARLGGMKNGHDIHAAPPDELGIGNALAFHTEFVARGARRKPAQTAGFNFDQIMRPMITSWLFSCRESNRREPYHAA